MRCPACRHNGTFEAVGLQDLDIRNENPSIVVGLRRCPDAKCMELVFVALRNGAVHVSFPAETIDFDSTSLPAKILASLEEAVTCHANSCFSSAAMMVRKTLEELCRERGAAGKNLKERLAQLRTRVVLPDELLDGLDNLRLLGNDAAHVESQHYDQVGKAEVELAIEIAKEVLKAVYQYDSLVKRLQALKTP